MTKIEIKKGEIEMFGCFQNFDRKNFAVFKIQKMYSENHTKKKNFLLCFS